MTILAAALMLLTMIPAAMAAVQDGTYESTAPGYHGAFPVSVTVQAGKIAEIAVGEHHETAGVADFVMEEMPRRIIEAQSWNVDLVSGATFTANAVKQGVRSALEAAGAQKGMFDAAPEKEAHDSQYTADVVVVGGGIAGLTAAIEAAEAGADVILLEKLGRMGGSTVLSGGNFYATGSQVNKDVDNDWQTMAQYLKDRADGLADEELIDYYCQNSGATVDWLIDHLGVNYGDSTGAPGYSTAKRQHYCVGRGAGLILPAYNKALELGVKVLMETRATKLITAEAGAVVGVEATDAFGKVTVNAKAVVLASGGYDRSKELMAKYSPIGSASVPTSGSGNTGDGLVMAMELGADTIFRNVVGGIQTINQWMYMEDGINMLVWFPTMFVTNKGKRFVNESEWYTTVYDEMAKLNAPAYYWVFDASTDSALCEQAVSEGYGFKADTIEELAEAAGMDPTVLKATFDSYNEAAKTGVDEAFGRTNFAPLSENGPYYAIHVLMATCDSIGGLRTDVQTRVLKEGQPIDGLYAAGEIASGQFFGTTYSSDGMMVGLSATFGRQAGVHAAAYAAQK